MLVDDGLRQSAQPGDIATGRVQLTGKAIEQGGFAVAIGGDDADAVSRIHGEAEIGKKRLSQNDSEVSKRDDGHNLSLAKRTRDEPWSAAMQYGVSVRDDPS
ncbi:hypothetical protein D3C80_1249470 [compost metagenome]